MNAAGMPAAFIRSGAQSLGLPSSPALLASSRLALLQAPARTASRTLKTQVVAPIPSAKVTTAARLSPEFLSSIRTAYRRSRQAICIHFSYVGQQVSRSHYISIHLGINIFDNQSCKGVINY